MIEKTRTRGRNGRSIREILSPRENEVMEAISVGLTNRQVADKLAVTVHAVKFHLASIYRKLGVANRTEAVSMFVREDAPTWPAGQIGGS